MICASFSALDGDVDFDPPALDLVLNRLIRNEKVAACCGQIHPKGDGYLVGYQRWVNSMNEN